jgi:LysM repeat protein
MRRLFACLILLLALPVSSSASAQTWKVRRGDNLTFIARRFDVAIDDLRRWNKLRSDQLHPGQQLVVKPEPGAGPRAGRGAGLAARSRRVPVPQPNVVVGAGDSLNKIAKRHKVTVSDLRLWNQELAGDHIQPGQRLRVGSFYAIKKNDTMGAIARSHEVEVDELLSWNPGLHRNRIRPGQRLVIFDHPSARQKAPVTRPVAKAKVTSAVPAKVTSVAPPKVTSVAPAKPEPPKPKLQFGVRLGKHSGYAIRNFRRSYGTQTTIEALTGAFDRMVKRHPKGSRLWVLDLSLPRGGPMKGHRSHEEGRDVDLTYYQHRCGQRACQLRRLKPHHLDAKRQWELFSYWLRRGDAQFIFIDYALQVPLYAAARKAGATKKQLDEWFQYPRKQKVRKGIIRHAENHRDHVHVRFRCPKRDRSCR